MSRILSLILFVFLACADVLAFPSASDVQHVVIYQDSLYGNYTASVDARTAGIEKALIHRSLWQAVSMGKLRLHNSVQSYLPHLPSPFDSIKLSHLLYETSSLPSGLSISKLESWVPSRKLKPDESFKPAKINQDLLLQCLNKLGLDSNLAFYLNAKYKAKELLKLQKRILNGDGLHFLFQEKIKTPVIRTGFTKFKPYYTGSWYKSYGNKDSLPIYFYPAPRNAKSFYYFVLPQQDFSLMLIAKKQLSTTELSNLLEQYYQDYSGKELGISMGKDQDLLMLIIILFTLSLGLLWLNRKKGKRRKSFRSSNNSMAILILILSLGLLAIYLIA